MHSRITEKTANVEAAPVLIVAFGDSVTQGFTNHATIDHEHVYHNRFKRALEMAYPLATFSVINAGDAGEMAAKAIPRLERDVLRHNPDFVIVGFGLNEAAGGADHVGGFEAALETMVERIRLHTRADLVLLTPNFMLRELNSNIHPNEASYAAGFQAHQRGGVVAAYAQSIRAIGQRLDVLVIDVYAVWEKALAGGLNTDDWLANGLNHPTGKASDACQTADRFGCWYKPEGDLRMFEYHAHTLLGFTVVT